MASLDGGGFLSAEIHVSFDEVFYWMIILLGFEQKEAMFLTEQALYPN